MSYQIDKENNALSTKKFNTKIESFSEAQTVTSGPEQKLQTSNEFYDGIKYASLANDNGDNTGETKSDDNNIGNSPQTTHNQEAEFPNCYVGKPETLLDDKTRTDLSNVLLELIKLDNTILGSSELSTKQLKVENMNEEGQQHEGGFRTLSKSLIGGKPPSQDKNNSSTSEVRVNIPEETINIPQSKMNIKSTLGKIYISFTQLLRLFRFILVLSLKFLRKFKQLLNLIMRRKPDNQKKLLNFPQTIIAGNHGPELTTGQNLPDNNIPTAYSNEAALDVTKFTNRKKFEINVSKGNVSNMTHGTKVDRNVIQLTKVKLSEIDVFEATCEKVQLNIPQAADEKIQIDVAEVTHGREVDRNAAEMTSLRKIEMNVSEKTKRKRVEMNTPESINKKVTEINVPENVKLNAPEVTNETRAEINIDEVTAEKEVEMNISQFISETVPEINVYKATHEKVELKAPEMANETRIDSDIEEGTDGKEVETNVAEATNWKGIEINVTKVTCVKKVERRRLTANIKVEINISEASNRKKVANEKKVEIKESEAPNRVIEMNVVPVAATVKEIQVKNSKSNFQSLTLVELEHDTKQCKDLEEINHDSCGAAAETNEESSLKEKSGVSPEQFIVEQPLISNRPPFESGKKWERSKNITNETEDMKTIKQVIGEKQTNHSQVSNPRTDVIIAKPTNQIRLTDTTGEDISYKQNEKTQINKTRKEVISEKPINHTQISKSRSEVISEKSMNKNQITKIKKGDISEKPSIQHQISKSRSEVISEKSMNKNQITKIKKGDISEKPSNQHQISATKNKNISKTPINETQITTTRNKDFCEESVRETHIARITNEDVNENQVKQIPFAKPRSENVKEELTSQTRITKTGNEVSANQSNHTQISNFRNDDIGNKPEITKTRKEYISEKPKNRIQTSNTLNKDINEKTSNYAQLSNTELEVTSKKPTKELRIANTRKEFIRDKSTNHTEINNTKNREQTKKTQITKTRYEHISEKQIKHTQNTKTRNEDVNEKSTKQTQIIKTGNEVVSEKSTSHTQISNINEVIMEKLTSSNFSKSITTTDSTQNNEPKSSQVFQAQNVAERLACGNKLHLQFVKKEHSEHPTNHTHINNTRTEVISENPTNHTQTSNTRNEVSSEDPANYSPITNTRNEVVGENPTKHTQISNTRSMVIMEKLDSLNFCKNINSTTIDSTEGNESKSSQDSKVFQDQNIEKCLRMANNLSFKFVQEQERSEHRTNHTHINNTRNDVTIENPMNHTPISNTRNEVINEKHDYSNLYKNINKTVIDSNQSKESNFSQDARNLQMQSKENQKPVRSKFCFVFEEEKDNFLKYASNRTQMYEIENQDDRKKLNTSVLKENICTLSTYSNPNQTEDYESNQKIEIFSKSDLSTFGTISVLTTDEQQIALERRKINRNEGECSKNSCDQTRITETRNVSTGENSCTSDLHKGANKTVAELDKNEESQSNTAIAINNPISKKRADREIKRQLFLKILEKDMEKRMDISKRIKECKELKEICNNLRDYANIKTGKVPVTLKHKLQEFYNEISQLISKTDNPELSNRQVTTALKKRFIPGVMHKPDICILDKDDSDLNAYVKGIEDELELICDRIETKGSKETRLKNIVNQILKQLKDIRTDIYVFSDQFKVIVKKLCDDFK